MLFHVQIPKIQIIMALGARAPKQLMAHVNTYSLGVVLSRKSCDEWTSLQPLVAACQSYNLGQSLLTQIHVISANSLRLAFI